MNVFAKAKAFNDKIMNSPSSFPLVLSFIIQSTISYHSRYATNGQNILTKLAQYFHAVEANGFPQQRTRHFSYFFKCLTFHMENTLHTHFFVTSSQLLHDTNIPNRTAFPLDSVESSPSVHLITVALCLSWDTWNQVDFLQLYWDKDQFDCFLLCSFGEEKKYYLIR